MTHLAETLHRIEDDGLVTPNASNYINQLDVATSVLGAPLHYSQPVEARVPLSAAFVRRLLPNMDEQDAKFLDVWQWQEEGHAASQTDLLRAFEIEPKALEMETSVLSALAGRLASVSAGFHEAVEVGVFTYMAVGELETRFLYRRLAKALSHVDEHDLSRIMGHTAKQEGMHLEYQSTVVEDRYTRLHAWQRLLVRTFIEKSYRPVGVQRNNTKQATEFGGVLLGITTDNGRALATAVEALAADLVEIGPPNAFIQRRYKECIDSFRETT